MNKKEHRLAVRQAAEKAALRDRQNRRITHAATSSVKEILCDLHTALCGLDAEGIRQPQSIRQQQGDP